MAASGPPERGFSDCFTDLVDRRLGELGAAWDTTAARSRRAEARRRAREEMVRRIAARTGRRYASSSVARWAAHNQWPPGAEPFWLERWAAIDRAGGIAAFAEVLGSSPARVVAWRDSEDPAAPPPGPIPARRRAPGAPVRVGVEVDGFAVVGTSKIPKKVPWKKPPAYQVLVIDPDSEILDAWFAGDYQTLKDLLGPVIAEQVIAEWTSASSYDVDYTVTDITLFLPNVSEEDEQ